MAVMIAMSTVRLRAMAKYYSAQQGIKENVNFLKFRLGSLRDKMRTHPERLRVSAAFLIPYRFRGTVDGKATILASPLEGEDAVAHAIHGLTSIHIEDGKQNPRETLRVPGVVAMPDEWIRELLFLNDLRSEIELLVKQIEDPRTRLEVWKAWPLMSGLQVMRQTRIVDGPKKVTFFWHSAPSVLKKTAKDWIEHYSKTLRSVHGYVPELEELGGADGSRGEVAVINALRHCNDGDLIAAFRFGRPHVRARITFHDTRKLLLRPAPTPIVYDIRDAVPKIIPLSNWEPDLSEPDDKEREREEREDKTRKQTISTETLVQVHGYKFYHYKQSKAR